MGEEYEGTDHFGSAHLRNIVSWLVSIQLKYTIEAASKIPFPLQGKPQEIGLLEGNWNLANTAMVYFNWFFYTNTRSLNYS